MGLQKLLDRKQLSAKTGIAEYTLGVLTRQGKIPTITLPGVRRFFYSEEAISEWIKSIQTGGSTK